MYFEIKYVHFLVQKSFSIQLRAKILLCEVRNNSKNSLNDILNKIWIKIPINNIPLWNNNDKTVHLKVKPYNCDTCEMSFFKKSQLKRHTKAAHFKNGYKCGHCHKSFSQKSSLEKHMKLKHPKLFKCETCEMSFSKIIHLKCHTNATHRTNGYDCEKCEKKFSLKSSLKRHMRLKHAN